MRSLILNLSPQLLPPRFPLRLPIPRWRDWLLSCVAPLLLRGGTVIPARAPLASPPPPPPLDLAHHLPLLDRLRETMELDPLRRSRLSGSHDRSMRLSRRRAGRIRGGPALSSLLRLLPLHPAALLPQQHVQQRQQQDRRVHWRTCFPASIPCVPLSTTVSSPSLVSISPPLLACALFGKECVRRYSQRRMRNISIHWW